MYRIPFGNGGGVKILFVGDIVGNPGRTAVRRFVPILRERHSLDLCIGNSENS
ncbi:MAG: YmdB family metallophosphoesterase, partial [Myxococcales bacterium]